MAMSEPHDRPSTWLPRPFRNPGARMSRSLADTAPHEGSDFGHRDQLRHGVGVEGDVLVEDEEVLAPGLGHSPVDAPRQGQARIEAEEPHPGVLAQDPRGRVVPRAVVDDDDFERLPGLLSERGQEGLEPAHAVVGHHHRRDARPGRLLTRAARGGLRPAWGNEPLEQPRLREAGEGRPAAAGVGIEGRGASRARLQRRPSAARSASASGSSRTSGRPGASGRRAAGRAELDPQASGRRGSRHGDVPPGLPALFLLHSLRARP